MDPNSNVNYRRKIGPLYIALGVETVLCKPLKTVSVHKIQYFPVSTYVNFWPKHIPPSETRKSILPYLVNYLLYFDEFHSYEIIAHQILTGLWVMIYLWSKSNFQLDKLGWKKEKYCQFYCIFLIGMGTFVHHGKYQGGFGWKIKYIILQSPTREAIYLQQGP